MAQCKAELKIIVNGEVIVTYFCTKNHGHKGLHHTEWYDQTKEEKFFTEDNK